MRQSIVTISNLTTKEFFFSTDHCQPHNLGEDWVSCTYTLPMRVNPRASLPSGVIESKQDLIIIFYDDMKEIENPNKKYQPAKKF